VQPTADYGLLWLCSPPRTMASCGCAAHRGLWPPVALQPTADYGLLVPLGFVITVNDAPQSVGLLWTIPYNTQHTQQKSSMSQVGFEPTIAVGEWS
jgi:hypothetical protein